MCPTSRTVLFLSAIFCLATAACGGAPFQAGEPSDPSPATDGGTVTTSPLEPLADASGTPATSDGGAILTVDASTPPAPKDGAPEPASDVMSPELDASAEDAPDPLCLQVTPGYGCPPGFPYVPKDAGPPRCCNAP